LRGLENGGGSVLTERTIVGPKQKEFNKKLTPRGFI